MENSEKVERNHLLDNVKGVLIFLVVFGHSMEVFKRDFFVAQTLYTFIYMFHMPVFVFISGYFSKNTVKAKRTAFRSFFIPYVVFNVLWTGMLALFLGKGAFSLITPGWALWYLLSMFFWRSFLGDFVRIKYIMPISIAVGLLAGVMGEFDAVLSLSRTIVFFPFFLAGYYCTEERLFWAKKFSKIPSVIIIALSAFLAFWVNFKNLVPVEFLYGNQSFRHFVSHLWVGILYRAVFYCIGFAFVFVLVNLGSSHQRFFSKIGRNTLSIYILHTYLLGALFGLMYFIPWVWGKLAVSFAASVMIVWILSRDHVNRWFTKLLSQMVKKITI